MLYRLLHWIGKRERFSLMIWTSSDNLNAKLNNSIKEGKLSEILLLDRDENKICCLNPNQKN
jgi:hypothetical protein